MQSADKTTIKATVMHIHIAENANLTPPAKAVSLGIS